MQTIVNWWIQFFRRVFDEELENINLNKNYEKNYERKKETVKLMGQHIAIFLFALEYVRTCVLLICLSAWK